MDLKTIEQLNNIYEPLYRKFKDLKLELKKHGFTYHNAGWFNMHSVKYKDDFIEEYFPIPVISPEGVGDIGLDFDYIFIETTISKEKAQSLNLNDFKNYNIEIYGVQDYLVDYYEPNISIATYKEKIQNSCEREFHLTIYLSDDARSDEVIDVIFKLKDYFF